MTVFLFLDTNYSGEEVDSEQEMENYLVCVVALHRMMLIEQSLMRGIIPLPHQPRVFELVIRESMDVIVQDGEVKSLIHSQKYIFFLI